MGLENTSISKAYEEARQQRLKENEKRMADLGLIKLSKTLSESVTSASKPQKRNIRPRTPKQMEDVERRRSSRVASLPAPVYREEVIDFRHLRRSYNRKFLHSGKCASNEERIRAIKEAEKIEGSLKAGHPSFIKPMLRSHVSSCFWLGLPTSFCRKYLPKNDETMVLEDEKGEECETLYIAGRTGLSGGWRGFSLDHNLDDGDALVFELVERTRFKLQSEFGRLHPCAVPSEPRPKNGVCIHTRYILLKQKTFSQPQLQLTQNHWQRRFQTQKNLKECFHQRKKQLIQMVKIEKMCQNQARQPMSCISQNNKMMWEQREILTWLCHRL